MKTSKGKRFVKDLKHNEPRDNTYRTYNHLETIFLKHNRYSAASMIFTNYPEDPKFRGRRKITRTWNTFLKTSSEYCISILVFLKREVNCLKNEARVIRREYISRYLDLYYKQHTPIIIKYGLKLL